MPIRISSTDAPDDFAPDQADAPLDIKVFDVVLDLRTTAAVPGGRPVLLPTFVPLNDPAAVRVLEDGITTYLSVPRGEKVIFNLSLSANWDWTFDLGDDGQTSPFRLKHEDHATHYKHVSSNESLVSILASSTVTSDDTTPEVQHPFNIYIKMAQPGTAAPLRLRIDPVTDNPPPRPRLDPIA